MLRVGLGFDIHRLVKGRKLVLGGVHIPFSQGLWGNSDADVILHAVSDSLLGALGKGDIGDYFKDNVFKRKKTKLTSQRIVKEVLRLLKKEKANIVNIDVVIILDKPRLLRYKRKLTKSLSRILDTEEKKVNLKIKSQEGIWQSNPANIMCLATVLIDVRNADL